MGKQSSFSKISSLDSRIYRKIENNLISEFKLFEELNLHVNTSISTPYFFILTKKIDPDRVGTRKFDELRHLRACFVVLMAAFIKEKGGKFHSSHYKFWNQQLPFILEATMAILYYDNQILDKKGGVSSEKSIVNNLLIGRKLHSQLNKYIIKHVTEKFRSKAVILVNDIIQVVTSGQYIERECNLYSTWLSNKEIKSDLYENLILDEVPLSTSPKPQPLKSRVLYACLQRL